METLLGDIIAPRIGKADPQTTPNAKFIGMEQVEAHTMRLLGTVPAATMKSGANTFQPSDVLYGRMRSYLNKVYQPDFAGLCSGEFIVFPETCAVSGRFLKYRLNACDFVTFANHINTGDRPRVDFDQIKVFNLLLPPKLEQERIADSLDELLSDLDAGMSALECLQLKFKLYRESVLKAAVEGALVPTKNKYSICRIGDAIESIGQGWSPKCEGQPSNDLQSWAVIKTTAIQPLRYLEEHNKQLPTTLKPRPHLELMDGDLLVTRAGPRTRVGITCLVKQTRPRLMLCDKAYRLRCKKGTLSPAFLEVVLNAPHIAAALDKLKTGINDSGLNLTQDRFSELLVPYPTPEEQQAIVEAVGDHFSVIEHLEADLEAKLKSAQALRQSILRHAFTGQLVPQNSNDEPAAELLKRIAVEREAFIHQKRSKKKPKANVLRTN